MPNGNHSLSLLVQTAKGDKGKYPSMKQVNNFVRHNILPGNPNSVSDTYMAPEICCLASTTIRVMCIWRGQLLHLHNGLCQDPGLTRDLPKPSSHLT